MVHGHGLSSHEREPPGGHPSSLPPPARPIPIRIRISRRTPLLGRISDLAGTEQLRCRCTRRSRRRSRAERRRDGRRRLHLICGADHPAALNPLMQPTVYLLRDLSIALVINARRSAPERLASHRAAFREWPHVSLPGSRLGQPTGTECVVSSDRDDQPRVRAFTRVQCARAVATVQEMESRVDIRLAS